MKLLTVIVFLIASSITVCFAGVKGIFGPHMYTYHLTVINLGRNDITGAKLGFGKKEKSVGYLEVGKVATEFFFETATLYPDYIEYYKVNSTAPIVLKGKQIKILDKKDPSNQEMRVEIDPENRTAQIRVVPPPGK